MATASKQSISPKIQSVLDGLRKRIRMYVWIEGLALAIIWLGLVFWIGLAIDYWLVLMGTDELPTIARALLLLICIGGLTYVIVKWIGQRAFVPLEDRSMAVLLERRFGGLQDSLVTSVELSEGSEKSSLFNSAMLRHTNEDALENMDQVQLSQVFRYQPLLSKVALAAVFILSIVLFGSLKASAFDLWTRRFYLLGDQKWERQAKIEVVGIETTQLAAGTDEQFKTTVQHFKDGTLKIAKGTDAKLIVRADTSANKIPTSCIVFFRADGGSRDRAYMQSFRNVQNGFQTFTYDGRPFKGVLNSFRFDVLGYDHRLRDFRVEVVDSPSLIDIQIAREYPSYMQRSPETRIYQPDEQIPQGTNVTVSALSNKPLTKLTVYDTQTDKSWEVTDVISTDGMSLTYPIPNLSQDVALQLLLHDQDGIVSQRPQYIRLRVKPDNVPKVETQLLGIGMAVTPDVIIPLEGSVKDDNGLHRTWFELGGGISTSQPESNYATDLTIPDNGQLEASVDLQQLRRDDLFSVTPGKKLSLAVFAQDRSNLNDQPNVGVSERFERDVVTSNELLTMLENREINLRRQFEDTVERVAIMRDSISHVKSSPASDDSTASLPDEAMDERRQADIRMLRVQRAITDSGKSTQELDSLIAGFTKIRLELINNRIPETSERQSRLDVQIVKPLKTLLDDEFPELNVHLKHLQNSMSDDAERDAAADVAAKQIETILLDLQAILEKMRDIETYNELLDIVRSLIEEQEALIRETEKERKNSIINQILPPGLLD